MSRQRRRQQQYYHNVGDLRLLFYLGSMSQVSLVCPCLWSQRLKDGHRHEHSSRGSLSLHDNRGQDCLQVNSCQG